MRARVEEFAAQMGVGLSAPERAPSTVAPLAATEYARDHGALGPMRDRLMDDYWVAGRDIESPEVIAAAAEAAGLDGGAAASAATDPAYVSRVAAAREQAHADNVSAIPTLLVGGFPIVGCQRWEVYQMVAEKRGVPRRR
jgi:predicted DsbA family dithiol-disulfide isomerase